MILGKNQWDSIIFLTEGLFLLFSTIEIHAIGDSLGSPCHEGHDMDGYRS